jgi:hypothetical protein
MSNQLLLRWYKKIDRLLVPGGTDEFQLNESAKFLLDVNLRLHYVETTCYPEEKMSLTPIIS